MIALREIMSRDVVTIGPDATLREAMELLAKQHISGVPVVRTGEVLGVVSSTDLLTLASAIQAAPPRDVATHPQWSPLDDHTVAEAMNAGLVSLPPSADIAEAAELMIRSHIHRVLVIDRFRRLVGIVTMLDIAKADAAAGEPIMTLREIMTPDVVTISPEASIPDAMRLLTQKRIAGAPVVADRAVLGVISTTDLLDFAASLPGVPTERPFAAELYESEPSLAWTEGTEATAAYFTEMWSDAGAELEERFAHVQGPEWDALEEHTVAEAMTRQLCSLPPTASAVDATGYMLRAGVHRILIMDGGYLLGIVTAKDLVRAAIGRPLDQNAAVVRARHEKRESGQPGGGAGRRDEVGPTGVHPMSAGPTPSGDAEIRTPAAWGQGSRGAAGYEDAGGSELLMRNDQLLGGLTAGPGGEPTIDIHTRAPDQQLPPEHENARSKPPSSGSSGSVP